MGRWHSIGIAAEQAALVRSVLRKDDDDWVKKCMEHEVEGSRPRGRPKKTWKEVVREDCHARKLNKEDAMDRCKWRKMIKEARWSWWVWVGECSFWYRPTRVVPDQRPLNSRCFTFLVLADPGSPGQRAVKRMCVCVYVTWLGVFVKQQSYTDTAVCMYRIQPICRESCRSMRISQLSYLPTWLALRLSLRLAKTWLLKITITKNISGM